jgi:transposase
MPAARKYVTYSTIAQGLHMTYNQVQHICRTALRPTKTLSGYKLVRKLDQVHVNFLTSLYTLEQWAGLTMKQRTVLFHRRFTDKRIAVTSLRRLYLRHGIRCKKVRLAKTMTQRVRRNFVQSCQRLLSEMEQAEHEGCVLVFADEICFTKRSIRLREWSSKNTNLTVDQEEVYVGYRAALASMTGEKGMCLVHVFEHPVKEPEFCAHMSKLRTKAGKRPIALFMDNLWVHKHKDVRELMAKLDIRPIYNVASSPEFNPIEAVFSKVKRQFSCQRLHNLVTKIGFNMEKEIEAAFNTIEPAHCVACARKSLFLLKRAAQSN